MIIFKWALLLNTREALNETIGRFKDAGIDSPRLDAELLLGNVLNCKTIDLCVNGEQELAAGNKARFNELAQRRLNHEPVQYILGRAEFMSLEFAVNENTLIPRPETEFVVESVLSAANQIRQKRPGRITAIDLGTGSGNIAVSIAVMLKDSEVYACDISHGALDIARANAKRHGVLNRITFCCGDLFEAFNGLGKDITADFITSNPPYVAEAELGKLQPEIVKYEPMGALVGGADGLAVYRNIFRDAAKWLKGDGRLILEIGETQLNDLKALINETNANVAAGGHGFKFVEAVKDLQGIDRVVIVERDS